MSRDLPHLHYILKNIGHIQRIISDGKEAFFNDDDKQAAVLYYITLIASSLFSFNKTHSCACSSYFPLSNLVEGREKP